jgi:large subunit ribosomal protein L21
MYAIVEIAGKQFKVEPETTVNVPLLSAEVGADVEFDKVLMHSDGDKVTFGKPLLKGKKVVATVVEHGREDKIIVFKMKRRKGYRRKRGHRQGVHTDNS